ncbi:MAG: ABC transporter permease [Candidatus Kapaibacterium sp.]
MRKREIGKLAGAMSWIVGTICLLPIVYLLILSVAGRWRFPLLLPEGINLRAWSDLLGGDSLGWSLLLSTLLSGSVALVATFGGFIASRYIARSGRSRGLLFLAYLPFAMSPVILGACIHILYITIGLAGSAVGVACAHLTFALGFGVVFFARFWSRERRSLEDLARLLGASRPQLYRMVLLPAARELLLICFMQTFLLSWFQYGLTLLIGAGRVKTLPLLVFMYAGEANVQYAALSGLMLIIPPVLMLWANRRFLYRYM